MSRNWIYIFVGVLLHATTATAYTKCGPLYDLLVGEGFRPTRKEVLPEYPPEFLDEPIRQNRVPAALDKRMKEVHDYEIDRESSINLHIPTATRDSELKKANPEFANVSPLVLKRLTNMGPGSVKYAKRLAEALKKKHGEPTNAVREELANLEQEFVESRTPSTSKEIQRNLWLVKRIAALQVFVPPKTNKELFARDPQFETLSLELRTPLLDASEIDIADIRAKVHRLQMNKNEPKIDLRAELLHGKDRLSRRPDTVSQEEVRRLAALEIYLGPESPAEMITRRETINEAKELLESENSFDKKEGLKLLREEIAMPHFEVIDLLNRTANQKGQDSEIRSIAMSDLEARGVRGQLSGYSIGKAAEHATRDDESWVERTYNLSDDDFKAALKGLSDEVRQSRAGAKALANRSLEFIDKMSRHKNPSYRVMALRSLVDRSEPEVFSILERALHDEIGVVNRVASQVLYMNRDPRAAKVLTRFSQSEGYQPTQWPNLRSSANLFRSQRPEDFEGQMRAAGRLRNRPLEEVEAALLNGHSEVREAALRAIAGRMEPELLPLIEDRLVNDPTMTVRRAAVDAVLRMRGQEPDRMIRAASKTAHGEVAHYVRERVNKDPALRERILDSDMRKLGNVEQSRQDELENLTPTQRLDRMIPVARQMAENVYRLPEVHSSRSLWEKFKHYVGLAPKNALETYGRRLAAKQIEFENGTPTGYMVKEAFADPETGLKVVEYHRISSNTKKEIVFAIAGTESAADVLSDMGAGRPQREGLEFKSLEDRLVQVVEEGHFAFGTGHSLGGGLIQALHHDAAKRLEAKGIDHTQNMAFLAFNPMGAGRTLGKDFDEDIADRLVGRNIIVEGDSIPHASAQIGENHVYPRQSYLPFGNHGIRAVSKALEGKSEPWVGDITIMPLTGLDAVGNLVGRVGIKTRDWFSRNFDAAILAEGQKQYAEIKGYQNPDQAAPWTRELSLYMSKLSAKEKRRAQEFLDRTWKATQEIYHRLRQPTVPSSTLAGTSG